MEKNYSFSLKINRANETTVEQNFKFEMFIIIFSIISAIPNIISIFIICFQKEKKLRQKIQIMLCISFIGIEIRFSPIISNDTYYKVRHCIGYSFIVISNYYQLIYSYIAYKLFTSPDDLTKLYNKFFIHIFPFILFFSLNLFVYINFDLVLYFDFITYPNKSQLTKISDICRILFFLLNIFFIIKLLNKIKHFSKMVNALNIKFAQKKYNIYKNKLKLSILGIVIVVLPYFIRDIFRHFTDFGNGEPLNNFIFSAFFHTIECLSGLIFWTIYIYNQNLLRRLLIIFRCKKESDYQNNFYEEKIYYEESEKSILTSKEMEAIDISIFSSVNNEYRNIDCSNFENEDNTSNDDETL